VARAGVAILAVLAMATYTSGGAAGAQTIEREAGAANRSEIGALLRTSGPGWSEMRSPHFVVYVERSPWLLRATSDMTDSLEAAWMHAVFLVGPPRDTTPITTLVTMSRTRFPELLRQSSKGVATRLDQRDFIILVHNDSVRAYTRHEVMHVIAKRVWGPAHRSAYWVQEGLATWADGRCLNTTVAAAASAMLHQRPLMGPDDVPGHFDSLVVSERHAAYLLSASVVGYVWQRSGRGGVERLWTGADAVAPLTSRGMMASGARLGDQKPTPSLFIDEKSRWRQHVLQEAKADPPLDVAAFQRHGCG
jgi:hypothetical protein